MYKIRVDTEKNRLYVSVEGYLTDDLVLEFIDKLKAAMYQLKSGFDIINDIRKSKPFSPIGVEQIKELMKYEVEQGRRYHLRVVDEKTFSIMQMDRVATKIDYNTLATATIEEAEKLLDEA